MDHKNCKGLSESSHIRPRERLFASGPGSLSDAELLAILLGTGTMTKPVDELAHDLLEHFGGLLELLQRDAAELVQLKGLGPSKAAALSATFELSKRCWRGNISRNTALTSPRSTAKLIKQLLGGLGHEAFACLFLDNRHRLIKFEMMFRGTVDSASVHPREVVKRALALNAVAVILAHNHPSGVSEPSEADRQLTQRLKTALSLVDIRVLDHFIVGDGAPLSFAERGMM